ncbi:MAG TPA: hypothetical protein VFI70_08980 [Nitrososphaeraceae archaeon]|nr:hypothetical protein [Nitrososphaeraceae archaeon]
MTLKELRKKFSPRQDQDLDLFFSAQPSATTLALDRLRNKPFWIWDKSAHRLEYRRTQGECCTNHILGLPKKNNVEMPLFPYEKLILDELFKEVKNDIKNKHIWIKKASALGITELFLRLIVHMCTKDDKLSGSEVCIITGPRLE